MKSALLGLFFLVSFYSNSQTATGYWYGNANVKLRNSYNNYLVELVLDQTGNNVKGILNYYFRNTYRSFQVSGSYNPHTRIIYFANIPISYFGSYHQSEVDCPMDFQGSLRVSRAGSNIQGSFIAKPMYKYTCPEIAFNLKMNNEEMNRDSILREIRSLKETYQVWRPSEADTLVAAVIQNRRITNYVVANQYKERANEIAQELIVEKDTIGIDFYDNGEIDGDSISVFVNNQLIASNQKLGIRSIHFDLSFDANNPIQEISMFADNMGSIPPNTALMVVTDGEKRYEVRLSSSFEKNATVRLRKKEF